MRYLIPAVLLLSACAAYKTVGEVRADPNAVIVSHDREPQVMAECVRDRLYTVREYHLDHAQPSVVYRDAGAAVVGRGSDGYKYVVDIDRSDARIALNSAMLFTDEARAALTENAEACATS